MCFSDSERLRESMFVFDSSVVFVFIFHFVLCQTVSGLIQETFHKQPWHLRQHTGRQSLVVVCKRF